MRLLRWASDGGVAMFDGVTVLLRKAPVIEGFAKIDQINYVPNWYAEVNGRPLSRQHTPQIDSLLERMAAGARTALLGETYGADN
jgi:hypothetical protein